MTYSPAQAGIMTGEDYFTSIGLIGGATGMAPIISADTTIPAVDAYCSGLTVAITDSVIKYTQTAAANANRQMSWSLGATYDKVFGLCYFQMGTSLDLQGFMVSENDYSGSQADNYVQDAYTFWNYPYGGYDKMRLYKRVGVTWTFIAEDTTICGGDDVPYSHAYGLAIYCEKGNPGVQKCFMKDGSTSQWIQIWSTADGAFETGFQSFSITTGYNQTNVGRMISPFYVWGS